MIAAITVLYVLNCLFLIMTVLLQAGKGGGDGLGVAFGGSSNTILGNRGAATFLSKLTVGSALLFMLLSIILAYDSSGDDSRVEASEAGEDDSALTPEAPEDESVSTPETTEPTPPEEETAPSEVVDEAEEQVSQAVDQAQEGTGQGSDVPSPEAPPEVPTPTEGTGTTTTLGDPSVPSETALGTGDGTGLSNP